jgi:predicted ester cyclase
VLVGRFYDEVWNRADESVARAILAPDFRFRGSLGPEHKGPEGFILYMRDVHAALGGYHCRIDDLIACGRRAAARVAFSGRHRAPFFGVAATGRDITWTGAAFFDCGPERIEALWVLGDIDSIKQQLGAAGGRPF